MTSAQPLCPFCGTALAERNCYGYLHHHRCPKCKAATCYELAAGQVQPVRCKGFLPLDPATDACPDCGCAMVNCAKTKTHLRCEGCQACWTPARVKVLHTPRAARCEHCGGTGLKPPAAPAPPEKGTDAA